MSDQKHDKLVELFATLSDRTRLRLLELMAKSEVSVGYLAGAVGEGQPKVSRHLAYMRDHGLVETRRDGKHIYYRIAESSDPQIAAIIAIVAGSLRPSAVDVPQDKLYDEVGTPNSREPVTDNGEMPIFLL